MAGDADHRVLAHDPAGLGERRVVLAHVHAVAAEAGGQVGLDESIKLYESGEKLKARCEAVCGSPAMWVILET